MGIVKKGSRRAGLALLRLSYKSDHGKVYSEDGPVTYLLGATATYDALKLCPERIRAVYACGGVEEYFHEKAVERAREVSVPVIGPEQSTRLSDGLTGRYSIVAEVDKWDDAIQEGSHIVLVDPSIPMNIGVIMRTASAFDVRNVAIVSEKLDTFNPQLIRYSMGARLTMHVETFPTIDAYIERFPDNRRYAFMLDGSTELGKVEKSEPYSLIFGNETRGLPPEFADFCQPVRIEQSSRVDSLNLSNAVAVASYCFARSAPATEGDLARSAEEYTI